MIGDAAGMIAPLAGDGIGMAMESAKLASFIIIESIKTKTRENILSEYQLSWEKQFHKRIRNAGIIQNLLLTKYRRKLLLSVAVNFPPLLQRAIKGTRKEYNM
jgi:flavin-dependent dehydrogenase